MIVIPAIDLMDGQCVRLRQGDFAKRTTYTPSPLEMACLFKKMGYEWLHIIDLDGAKQGGIGNREVIAQILKETDLKVQIGGGMRDLQAIEDVLSLGVDRVIIGTLAVKEPELIQAAIEKFGTKRIVVAMDVKNGEIRIKGWQEGAKISPNAFLKKMMQMAVTKVLLTDISKDGLRNGIDSQLYKKFVRAFPKMNFIAAGGIRTAQDRKQLAEVGVFASIMGAVFYEGSFLTKRIIPCLDVKDGRTVKGVNFLNLQDAGDPVELAKLYSEQGADELCFLDITASADKRKTIVELVEKIAKEISIPFTVGGGVNTIGDIRAVLGAGADKVSIGSGIVKNPDLINEASKAFGSQCIVASIDAKKVDNAWRVTVKGGRELTPLDALEWAEEVEQRGAGEILLNSVDYDGTKQGFDLELLKAAGGRVKIPVIASGGAGSIADFVKLFEADVADAGLAASIFHFGEIAIPELKKGLISNSINIRP